MFFKSKRSFCEHCEKAIPAWYNIPILSFLFLRGRTACCHQKIGLRTLVVETLTPLLFMYIFFRYPFLDARLSPGSFDLPNAIRCLHALTLSSVLIVCSFIDWEHLIIPDVISLPMTLLTPVVVALHPELSWKSAVLGVLFGGGIIYTISWLYYVLRKAEGLGLGDAKLLAFLGGWLGVESLVPILFLSSIVGSFYGVTLAGFNTLTKKEPFTLRQEIPFGPFLSMAALFYLLSPVHWTELF